ncbi:MAG TPA: fatty acid desaturase [Caulobacteraceae bacterium]
MSVSVAAPESDLSGLSTQELLRLERSIAEQFIGGLPWGSILWAFTNLAVWLSLWPLTISGVLPLWVAAPIATLNVILAYLPCHEAQHRIIAREGEPLFWLNELVGHLSPIPMLLAYEMGRLTHYEHHRHANDPVLDPDINTRSNGAWHMIVKDFANQLKTAPPMNTSYAQALERIDTDDARRAGAIALFYELGFNALLFAFAWAGYALEVGLIWWLPRVVGGVYVRFFLSWAPHHPAADLGRYKDTRGFRSRLGNILTMGMQYHIIHHLYPRMPLMRHPAAFRALRPVLVARGCRLDGI